MSEIHLRVVTPEGIYKEFDTPYLNFQSTDGDRGILPNHMPLVTSLKIGKLTCEEEGKRQTYAVAGGLLYFRENLAEILTDAIERSDEIDTVRAKAAQSRAEQRLQSGRENLDVKRAQLALARALNRITVAGL